MPNKKPSVEKLVPDDPYVVSAVNLKKSDWKLLRRVADARADLAGKGRRSMSAVIATLIEERREELVKESQG